MKEHIYVVMIGSTQYRDKMLAHQQELENEGYKVSMPSFDDASGMDELDICKRNRMLIEESDEVHLFWDGRSVGTVLDFGMAFALRKVVKIIYLEPKTIAGVMRKYEDEKGREKQCQR